MSIIYDYFDHKAAAFIMMALMILVFVGGWIWVTKKQRRQRNFLYKLFLVLLIFLRPFILLNSGIGSSITKNFFSWDSFFECLVIFTALHGIYAGYKLLDVNERTKKKCEVQCFLNRNSCCERHTNPCYRIQYISYISDLAYNHIEICFHCFLVSVGYQPEERR